MFYLGESLDRPRQVVDQRLCKADKRGKSVISSLSPTSDSPETKTYGGGKKATEIPRRKKKTEEEKTEAHYLRFLRLFNFSSSSVFSLRPRSVSAWNSNQFVMSAVSCSTASSSGGCGIRFQSKTFASLAKTHSPNLIRIGTNSQVC